MRPCALVFLGGLVLALLASAGTAADKKKDPAEAAATRLVAQLGNFEFRDREAAAAALEAMGAEALPVLRRAAQDNDAEVRRRCRELIECIEKHTLSARLLEPRLVHLAFQDMPVPEALATFNRISGYNLELGGDKSQLAGRKITLDTGMVSFWDAFDQFCTKAGLVEAALLPDASKAASTDQPMPLAPWTSAYRNPYSGLDVSKLVLVDGKVPELPACRTGAVRVRLLPKHAPLPVHYGGDNEKVIGLEVAPEPGMLWQGILSLRVEHASDDRGRPLTQPDVALGEPVDTAASLPAVRFLNGSAYYDMGDASTNPKHIAVRLQMAGPGAKAVKELQGKVCLQVQTPPEPLIAVENILKANGETVKGPSGGAIKILEIKQDANGQVNVRLTLELPPPEVGDTGDAVAGARGFGRGFRINRAVMRMRGGVAETEAPEIELFDAQGQPFQRTSATAGPSQAGVAGVGLPGVGFIGGPLDYQLTFVPRPGQAEPARLVYNGRRTVTIDVPFKLENVPLP
jgi:hypothetical protein